MPFAHPLKIIASDYDALAGTKVVVLCAGVNQKPGETRLQLLQRNAEVFADVVPRVLGQAPDAILVVATNPVDIMTHLAARYAEVCGISSSRVLGSGTTLDTARFRSLLATHCGIDSHHVHAHVIGEHGDSEVLTWSLASVAGMPLQSFTQMQGIELSDAVMSEIDQKVRRAAYSIIQGKGATYYGIGSALARLVDVILHDQRAVLTICTPTDDIVGVHNTTVSLPRLLGGDGVLATFNLPLAEDETIKLRNSAQIIRQILDDLK
jgi:L-lactate dehydrogenase